jgi:VanZ family protein
MLIIFFFSSQPSSNLPDFNWLDRIVKKGGHMVGYGLLAVAYWRVFDLKGERRWLVWLLCMLYAVSDEWHQSKVPGRHPSAWDIMIFDNFGALISLWLISRHRKQKQPKTVLPVPR